MQEAAPSIIAYGMNTQ